MSDLLNHTWFIALLGMILIGGIETIDYIQSKMTVEQFHVFQREVEVFAAQDLGVQFVDDQAVPVGWAA